MYYLPFFSIHLLILRAFNIFNHSEHGFMEFAKAFLLLRSKPEQFINGTTL